MYEEFPIDCVNSKDRMVQIRFTMCTLDVSIQLITKPMEFGYGIKTELVLVRQKTYGFIFIKTERVAGYISLGTKQELISSMIIKIRPIY